MIRTRIAGADALVFSASPSDKPPLHVLMMVGSDSWQGDTPFGHSAVEPYRCINPLIAASRGGITGMAVKVHMIDPRREDELWKWADVIVYVRTWPRSPEIFAKTVERARREGKALILDMDDWVYLPEGHPSKPFFDQVIVPYVADYLPLFDRVICATEPLAEKVRPYNRTVVICPNTINPADWVVKTPRRVKGLTIGWQGGGTHYEDTKVLGEVWPILAEKYPEVTFVVAGYLADYLRACVPAGRLVCLPYVPLALFPASVDQIDIACCPLLDSEWARCKSPIKWMESAILGKVVIASPTVYGAHIQDNITGYIAETPDEWVNSIDMVVSDPDWRWHIGQMARRAVIETFSIDALAERWSSAFRGAWEERR